MPALDTHVLVRLLVADDAEQHQAVVRLLEDAIEHRLLFFVPNTVMLELEWVLRSRHGYTKAQINAGLVGLMRARELLFESEFALEVALHAHAQHPADFADCFHAAVAQTAGHSPLLTFDRKAAGLPGAQLLGA